MLFAKKKAFFAFVIVLLITLPVLRIYNTPSQDAEALSLKQYKELDILGEALFRIQSSYVQDVDTEELIYGAINGMTKTLDPYSSFMDPESFKELRTETTGNFEGVGIRITVKDNYITVITPIEGTPAYRMGIMAGDKIVKIDGEDAQGITLMEAVKKIRGTKGSVVLISILREGEKELRDFSLTRDVIKIESVRHHMLDDSIGYVRITDFKEKTANDLSEALTALEKEDMKSLILDLRNNPGGLLGAAVDVCKMFISDGKLIVYTLERNSVEGLRYHADKVPLHPEVPLVVLINGGSASGSEIVAGAIQDNKAGLLLGTQTFGKGSVQTIFPLSNGAGLRLTTAKYYTPRGTSIHEVGITPDIVVDIPKDTEMKLMMQSEGVSEGEEKVEDIQLERAKDILTGARLIQQNR